MRVLGVDPGLTRCGIGIIDGEVGAPLSLVKVSLIQTSSELPLEQRLKQLEEELQSLVNEFEPDVIAVERVFSQLNVRTVMGTGQASGIALLVAAKSNIRVVLHTPTEVKAAVTGSGRASKAQVAEMVKRLLRLATMPKPVDTTDALALAICHLWRGQGDERIAQAFLEEATRLKALRSS